MKIVYETGWFHDATNDVVQAADHIQGTGQIPVGEVLSLHIRRQGEGWEWERTTRRNGQ